MIQEQAAKIVRQSKIHTEIVTKTTQEAPIIKANKNTQIQALKTLQLQATQAVEAAQINVTQAVQATEVAKTEATQALKLATDIKK